MSERLKGLGDAEAELYEQAAEAWRRTADAMRPALTFLQAELEPKEQEGE